MKFDCIVGLGDSWMWGDELVDPDLGETHAIDHRNDDYRQQHCFLGLIGQHYGVPTVNMAWPGGTNQLSIYNYIWWMDNCYQSQQALFLVALTDGWRMTWFNPRHVRYSNDPPWNQYHHNTWLRHRPAFFNRDKTMDDWVKFGRLYDVLTDCQAARAAKYKQAVWFFEGQQHCHNHAILQFNVAQPPCELETPTMIWPNQNVKTFVDPSDFKSGGHPDEKGHQRLANLLISQIDML